MLYKREGKYQSQRKSEKKNEEKMSLLGYSAIYWILERPENSTKTTQLEPLESIEDSESESE